MDLYELHAYLSSGIIIERYSVVGFFIVAAISLGLSFYVGHLRKRLEKSLNHWEYQQRHVKKLEEDFDVIKLSLDGERLSNSHLEAQLDERADRVKKLEAQLAELTEENQRLDSLTAQAVVKQNNQKLTIQELRSKLKDIPITVSRRRELTRRELLDAATYLDIPNRHRATKDELIQDIDNLSGVRIAECITWVKEIN